MHILVSNDDGYQAPGLLRLVSALRELAEVTVVAPDRDRSGASNSLSLKNPLYVTRHAFQRWVQRTGRSELEMLGALSRAWRPSKRQLRRIRQREAGWSPRRILECDHAYFILKNGSIVTVYDKH